MFNPNINNMFIIYTGSLSAGASPLHSQGTTPTASPGSKRKDRTGSHPPPLDITGQYKPTMQENIGGTTYFYTDEQPHVNNKHLNLGSKFKSKDTMALILVQSETQVKLNLRLTMTLYTSITYMQLSKIFIDLFMRLTH